MDSYLSKTSQKHIPQDLHLVCVTTMFMSCKFEEIYPVKLQIVHEKIAHKKLNKEDIKEKETNILTTLDFSLVGITVLDVIIIVLSILNMNQKLYQITLYLAKLVLYDHEFINNHTYVQIACAALIVSTKIVEQIDKSLSSEVVISLIVSTSKIENSDAMESANQLLNFAKGFDKQYPNLEILKNFKQKHSGESHRFYMQHYQNSIFFAMILFLCTLIGMKKESNKYSKDELKYILEQKMPFKRKPKDYDDDNNGNEGTKPKIIRGLGGVAECKS